MSEMPDKYRIYALELAVTVITKYMEDRDESWDQRMNAAAIAVHKNLSGDFTEPTDFEEVDKIVTRMFNLLTSRE